MNDLIDQIKYDHISMSKVLNLMEREVGLLAEDQDPDYFLLVDCMRYMVNYSDTVHHIKEDAIFERLAEIDPDVVSTVNEIRQQHKSLALLSTQLYDIVRNASLGELVSKNDISKLSNEYVGSLRRHMSIEEGNLLRRARDVLSTEDMNQVEQQYANFRDPLLSGSLEQEYNKLYLNLMV
ncbi:MAG: hemerythrin domain-containing protein [bacterium]